MPAIELEIEDLKSRGDQVRNLLRPLTRNDFGPAWVNKNQNRIFVIGTHDGSPPTSSYREWRFSTFVPNIRAMYFELWRELIGGKWYLDRAYLSLFKTDLPKQKEIEIICLHCDPNEPLDSEHIAYKKGPHLHIKGVTPYSLDQSHIALQQERHLDLVLSSSEELTIALTWGIRMIKEEILDTIFKDLVNTL
jgi:hypothetical protein